jgi:hypothetical protein
MSAEKKSKGGSLSNKMKFKANLMIDTENIN